MKLAIIALLGGIAEDVVQGYALYHGAGLWSFVWACISSGIVGAIFFDLIKDGR